MKNIYLYGASDDCHELESDFGASAESYSSLKIDDVFVDYEYNGDWKINLRGELPKSWVVKNIEGTSDFIHIQIPDDEQVKIYEPATVEETREVWNPVN